MSCSEYSFGFYQGLVSGVLAGVVYNLLSFDLNFSYERSLLERVYDRFTKYCENTESSQTQETTVVVTPPQSERDPILEPPTLETVPDLPVKPSTSESCSQTCVDVTKMSNVQIDEYLSLPGKLAPSYFVSGGGKYMSMEDIERRNNSIKNAARLTEEQERIILAILRHKYTGLPISVLKVHGLNFLNVNGPLHSQANYTVNNVYVSLSENGTLTDFLSIGLPPKNQDDAILQNLQDDRLL